MQITVEAPEGAFCNGCDCLSYNHYDVAGLRPILHVYCRKLKKVWESKSLDVVKHHDCPTKNIERIEDGKSGTLHRTIPQRNTKDTGKTKVDW